MKFYLLQQAIVFLVRLERLQQFQQAILLLLELLLKHIRTLRLVHLVQRLRAILLHSEMRLLLKLVTLHINLQVLRAQLTLLLRKVVAFKWRFSLR